MQIPQYPPDVRSSRCNRATSHSQFEQVAADPGLARCLETPVRIQLNVSKNTQFPGPPRGGTSLLVPTHLEKRRPDCIETRTCAGRLKHSVRTCGCRTCACKQPGVVQCVEWPGRKHGWLFWKGGVGRARTTARSESKQYL